MKIKVLCLILLSVLSLSTTFAQKKNKKITISGIVVDAAQRPVSGALIMVDDKKTSYVTDSKGWYEIKVKPDAVKIGVFQYSNGLTEEVIKERTQINFTLGNIASKQQPAEKASPAQEEINVGYGTVQKGNLNSPVGKIDGTKKKYNTYNTIYDMISGEVAGVRVDGESIKIRGEGSINLSTEPLLIVDGMQVSTINNISPQMVESIEVLKGSAATIYGSSGGNGVILITLKRSSEKKK